MTWILVKLGIRLAVFITVFWLATKKNEKIKIEPRWAIPLVAGLFGVFNIGLYWLCKPILEIATFGALAMTLPFVINGVFLYATARAVEKKRWLQIDGFFATIWLALILTAAHGALWFALDYVPSKM